MTLPGVAPTQTGGPYEEHWGAIRAKLAGTKPARGSWYFRVMREFVNAGFKLADADMEAAYIQLVGPDWDSDYFAGRTSTYPAIRPTKPNEYGIYAYSSHDRSENVHDAIERLAEIHAKDIEEGKAWLMPVCDDDEYVSWEFDVMVGRPDEIVAALRAAAAQTQPG